MRSALRHRVGSVARRLLPLVLLLPLSLAVRPLFWVQLDQRFHDFYLSLTAGPEWRHVVVVGIDLATRTDLLPPPANPLSRHTGLHADVIRRLDAAGARAIVLDFALSVDEIADVDTLLTGAMKSSGKVHLIAYLEETVQESPSGRAAHILRVRQPVPALLAASRGAFLADVTLDQDSVLRRFAPELRARGLGTISLPEQLAGVTLDRAVPISFPTMDRPLPVVSYAAVLRGDREALAAVKGRIVFVGQVEDPLGDFVPVPTLQRLGGGQIARGLPGVCALAAITETLLQGQPLRDASARTTSLWTAAWCALVLVLPPRRRPRLGMLTVFLVLAAALLVTGALQIRSGLALPAGTLAGSLLLCGGYAIVAAHVASEKQLHAEKIERQRVHRELETARRTQLALLPAELPQPAGWEIWGVNESSLEVSGDYYDVIETDGGRRLWLVIADVSGKGMPASLIMSNVHAGLQVRIRGGADDPGAIATDLGRFLNAHTAPERFVTAFLACLDLESGDMQYVSAGHEAPLLVTASGEWRDLEIGGPPLGVVDDFFYESRCCRLAQGDTLCAYTDGVTEATETAGAMYDLERLKAVVAARHERSAGELGRAIMAEVRAFQGEAPQADDITLLIVRSCGPVR